MNIIWNFESENVGDLYWYSLKHVHSVLGYASIRYILCSVTFQDRHTHSFKVGRLSYCMHFQLPKQMWPLNPIIIFFELVSNQDLCLLSFQVSKSGSKATIRRGWNKKNSLYHIEPPNGVDYWAYIVHIFWTHYTISLWHIVLWCPLFDNKTCFKLCWVMLVHPCPKPTLTLNSTLCITSCTTFVQLRALNAWW